jgi:hypothetical protein
MARRTIRITVETIRIVVSRPGAAPVEPQAEAKATDSPPKPVLPEPPEDQLEEND